MEDSQRLIDQFVKAVELTTATTEVIPANKRSLNDALLKATGEDDFVLLSDPDDLDKDLFSLFKPNKKVISKPDTKQLANIQTGVTDAFCGVASSGSVCVPVSKTLSSPLSMLTRKHIVVLHGQTIVSRPRDVFDEKNLNGKGLNCSFSFISGPSATADMGSLVRGVHGPQKVHIIILE